MPIGARVAMVAVAHVGWLKRWEGWLMEEWGGEVWGNQIEKKGPTQCKTAYKVWQG